MSSRLWSCLGLALLAGCAPADPEEQAHACGGGDHEEIASLSAALSSIDCSESQETGYSKGTAFPITVVTVDGKPVEVDTANAYYVMAQKAASAGVNLKVVSGFRTMAEQQYFYNCYINCNCNNCNLAAKPGYSNHQSGHALDLNTSSTGVYNWLAANAAAFGFKRTVSSEPWHWEWWGGGPGGGPCGKPAFAGESLGVSGQSYPIASQGAVHLEVGQTVTGWVKLKNTGTETWQPGTVRLAPIPRDQPSPFASASWLATHRISTTSTAVAPGQIAEFPLDLTGSVAGESLLSLGWVAEGITWFADGPKGGGPKDGYFAIKVNVVAASTPPPEPEPQPPPDPEPEPEPQPEPGSGGSAGSSGAPPATGGSGWSGSSGWQPGTGGSPSSEPVAPEESDNGAIEGGCTTAPSGPSSPAPVLALLIAAACFQSARRRRSRSRCSKPEGCRTCERARSR
jgi:hypothetical protein